MMKAGFKFQLFANAFVTRREDDEEDGNETRDYQSQAQEKQINKNLKRMELFIGDMDAKYHNSVKAELMPE